MIATLTFNETQMEAQNSNFTCTVIVFMVNTNISFKETRPDQEPEICLGMPLYNQTKYLPEALNSLLAQTYNNFRLVIADDSTEPGPGQIVKSFSEKDSRITYFKNENRLGLVDNWKNCFHLAGHVDYFGWVGDHDVYFIPVYTAGAGGVVTEIGIIACVGASFTGEYYVGLGDSAEDAYRSYLTVVAGIEEPVEVPVEYGMEERKKNIIQIFDRYNITVVEPEEMFPNVSFFEGNVSYRSSTQFDSAEKDIISFINTWGKGETKILYWVEGDKLYFGFMVNVEGVIELHYVTLALE